VNDAALRQLAIDLYLDVLKKALTRALYPPEESLPPTPRELDQAQRALDRALAKFGALLNEREREAAALLCLSPEQVVSMHRANTKSADCLTVMSGINNLQRCVETVIADGIPGDLMECGVWRGGLCVVMRGLLKAFGEPRLVWVADSFQGLPTPDEKLNLKDAVVHELMGPINHLSVSLADVQEVFRRYDLLDEQVKFLPGWFDDTIPTAPVERLAVLRLDGDYYESTRTCLEHLYPKLSVGGFLILDDYGLPVGERQAVDEYRQRHGVTDKLEQVNDQEFYWRKSG
jgi:O-methyltransferase